MTQKKKGIPIWLIFAVMIGGSLILHFVFSANVYLISAPIAAGLLYLLFMMFKNKKSK